MVPLSIQPWIVRTCTFRRSAACDAVSSCTFSSVLGGIGPILSVLIGVSQLRCLSASRIQSLMGSCQEQTFLRYFLSAGLLAQPTRARLLSPQDSSPCGLSPVARVQPEAGRGPW